MEYKCPKGHMSTDPDYCSECGAKMGQSSVNDSLYSKTVEQPNNEEICPDCGTPRTPNARFCEVCRHDFVEGKTGTAEKVVAASQPVQEEPPRVEVKQEPAPQPASPSTPDSTAEVQAPVAKNEIIIGEKLNIIISVDKNRLSQNQVDTNLKPDSVDRIFPLDLDENLVGRRSAAKGIYPEIEINDPGVSHRHLKFIKQPDGTFAVLELGSANGTELNCALLEPGVNTVIKPGDEFAIGLWTALKVAAR
jgi:FHA domain.